MSNEPEPATLSDPILPSPDVAVSDVAVSEPDALPVTTAESQSNGPIVARYGQYYRNTRYIMTAITIVMGFWFLYDGFVRYPAENKKVDEIKAQLQDAQSHGDSDALSRLSAELKSHTSHSPTDLAIQRILAFALPPAGLLLLLWALYNSRGEYRLDGEMLSVPGHPPMSSDAVRELDETAWDRKGIATLKYTLPDGRDGRIKLDDFVYERTSTDRIYDRIRASMQTPAEPQIEPPVSQ